MKKLMTLAAAGLIALGAVAGNGEGEKETYKANTEKSKIFWTGKKVTGEHTGTLLIKDGTIVIEDGKPVSASFDIDMNTIAVTDIKDPETNGKLVGHLKSPDFFAVSSHPVGQFVATEFIPLKGAGDREPNYTVKGKLTLKGISNDIEFPALISTKGGKLISNGNITFDRTKYEINFRSGSIFDGLGDSMIYDEVTLNYVLAAEK